MLTVIGALGFYVMHQQGQIAEIESELPDLRGSVGFLSPMAADSETQAKIYQNYLDASPTPSQLLRSVEDHFVKLQAKAREKTLTDANENAAIGTSLTINTIPESKATYLQRYQYRVFVPADETVQIRLAVFPCTKYQPKDAPPISNQAANTILMQNPFSVPTPVYIDLPSGEHTVLVRWRGDSETVTVSINDVQQYESRYTIKSKLSYKYQVLGSSRARGLHEPKDTDEVIMLRTICPGGGPRNDPMLHAWKCELVRGSELEKSVAVESAVEGPAL